MATGTIILPLTPGEIPAVASLNGETGAITLVGGSGITITPSGQNITIAATGSELIFADSLVNTAGTVTLVNDTASPAASQYYGTNGSSVLGYFNLPTSISLGAFGSTPNVSGASLTSGVLTLQPADGTNPGGLSTTTQTIAGAKTFSSPVLAANGTNGAYTFTDGGSNTFGFGYVSGNASFTLNGTPIFWYSSIGEVGSQPLYVTNGSFGRPDIPAITLNNQFGTGLYAPAANQIGVSASSTKVAVFSSAGLELATAFTLDGSTSGAISLQAAATTTSYTVTLPSAQGTGALTNDGSGGLSWAPGNSGTVTSVSVVSANGLAGTVATATTTPAITLSTTITGILQGNGTAISAATTTGSGSVVLATSPSLTTPALDTPSSVTLTNATGLPLTTGVTGTLAIANGGTGQTGAAAAFNALSPMTTLGDLTYESGANTASRLAGNTTLSRKFLRQTGAAGPVSAAPAWDFPLAVNTTAKTGTYASYF